MKKTLIILTSVVIVALFIGTSMTTAIARESLTGDIAKEVETRDSAISEELQVIEEETECAACAAAAQIEDMDNGEETLQGAPSSGDPPCDPCRDLMNEAFEDTSSYIIDNLPTLPENLNLINLLEYILDVRDVFIWGIGLGIAQIGLEFAQYLDDAVITGVGTFFDELLNNGYHPLPAAILGIAAVVDFFIQVCKDLSNGEEPQSAPASAPASAPVSAPAATQSVEETMVASASASTPAGSMSI